MKKYIFSLFTLLAMTFTAVTLTSCGDDDDNFSSQDSVDGVSIVGTWRYYFDSNDPSRGRVYDIMTFNSNHTGSLIEEVGYGSDTPESFTWAISGNTITIRWDEEPDKYETVTIVQVIDDNTVTVSNGKKTRTMYRQ